MSTSRTEHVILLVTTMFVCALAPLTSAEEPKTEPGERIFEQAPFDLIIDRTKAVNKVQPLTLPNRQLPKDPKPGDKLIARSFDNPDRDFEITWRSVVEVKLFEQMVLAEANALVAAGRFDEAYDYFIFLRREHPKLTGLKEGWENYLFADAQGALKQGRAAMALGLLNEVHQLNASHAGLSVAIGDATDKLVEQYVDRNDLVSARALLDQLARKLPKHTVADRWQKRFSSEAAEMLAQAKAAAEGGKLGEARDLAHKAIGRQPSLPGIRETVAEFDRRYPIVAVGVTSLNSTGLRPLSASSARLIDFAARRTERLQQRHLFEFTAAGSEGGDYLCPLGTLDRENLGARLVFRLKPGVKLPIGGTLSGYGLAQRIVTLADLARPDGDADWASVFANVEVRDVFEVDVDLRRPHLRPEALLDVSIAGDSSQSFGPYQVAAQSSDSARYLLADHYFAARPEQPKEVLEHAYPDRKTALAAFRRGEVAVVDRINPWDIATFRSRDDVAAGRYGVPAVHCLVPNLGRTFAAHRVFRRAVEFGTDRSLILEKQLLRGQKIAGCELVSGPFTSGSSYDDPLRYAYREAIKARPYEPRMAMTLASVALREIAAATKDKGTELTEIPPLVLAHPADDVARLACQAIQKHLQVIGVTVRLEELPPGETRMDPAKHDFVYAELTMAEPLVDARRLLSPSGLVGGANPYINLALDQLDAASGWREAREKLQQIHQLAHDDLTIIPLWQLVDHYAYHKSIRGIGNRPFSLYQNIEQWQVEPKPSAGKP